MEVAKGAESERARLQSCWNGGAYPQRRSSAFDAVAHALRKVRLIAKGKEAV